MGKADFKAGQPTIGYRLQSKTQPVADPVKNDPQKISIDRLPV